jgi:hypothetical protein
LYWEIEADMSQSFLAFKYVFIAAMMNYVNEYAARMQLPIKVPVEQAEVRFLHVSRPFVRADFQNYGGRLQVKNYSFTFGPGSLAIYNLDEHGFVSFGVPMGKGESSASGMERASRMKYVVSTNDVYRMATNWIAALDIDVNRLEAANPPSVNRNPLFKSNRGWVPSPLLTVEWNNPRIPGYDPSNVMVEISSVTGELLKLRIGNNDFCRKKRLLPDGWDKLLSISDEEFLKYNAQQRRELAEKFGVKIEHDFMTNIPTSFYEKLFTPSPKEGSNSP